MTHPERGGERKRVPVTRTSIKGDRELWLYPVIGVVLVVGFVAAVIVGGLALLT